MAQLKLRVKKAGSKNPVNKQLGLTARVLTNGTADFDDIVKDAGRNTTMHKAELRMAFELCLDSVTAIHPAVAAVAVATTSLTRTDNGKKSRADVWSARFFFVPSQA